MKPLAVDLFCGLGGWAEGLLAEGWAVIGFDIEQHVYGEHRYPAQLVLQDVLTLHGSQFKGAALIVASPPCQEFSYMAMPWSLAKAKAAAIRADTTGKMLADLTALFDACFRIAGQASLAAGRRVPLIVENVRGAQPWVGRSRWNFGSYHLWGDVPPLMPPVKAPPKQHGSGAAWFDKALDERRKEATAIKNGGLKVTGDWFGNYADMKAAGTISPTRLTGKGTTARKAASAMIAKIPEPLARHIAQVYRP